MLFCIMKKNNYNIEEQTNLVLVPVQMLDEIKQLLNELKLQQTREVESTEVLGDFVSEREARKIIGRRTTWFYEQRRSGKLPYSKVGSKVFYSIKDIHSLISKNHDED